MTVIVENLIGNFGKMEKTGYYAEDIECVRDRWKEICKDGFEADIIDDVNESLIRRSDRERWSSGNGEKDVESNKHRVASVRSAFV